MTREEFETLDEWVFINVKHNRDNYSRAKIIEMIMHRAEELVNKTNDIHDVSNFKSCSKEEIKGLPKCEKQCQLCYEYQRL